MNRLAGLVIYAASWIVPDSLREDWLREWQAEFAHAREVFADRAASPFSIQLWRFALGSLQDAQWTRRNCIEPDFRGYRRSDSPVFCLGVLLALLLVIVIASLGLPVTRSVITPLPYAHAARIATIAEGGIPVSVRSSIRRDWFRLWRHDRRLSVQDMATYVWKNTNHAHREPVLEAEVSPNFFELLGARADHGRLTKFDEFGVVLSYRFFDRATREGWISSTQRINLAGRNYQVVGVLEPGFWFLSRDIQVWALDDTKSSRTGVVARIRSDATKESVESELIATLQASGLQGWSSLVDVSMVQQRVRDVFLSFTFAVGMAMIITGVALRFPISIFEKGAVRQTAFFCAKTGLALLSILLAGLEFTHASSITMTGGTDFWAEPLSTWLFLMTSMGALAWSILDQRRRCRVCLAKLGLAAHVGCPGCLLLNWAGTELVCMEGHGMLHVPEMTSSWGESERWTELDESWEGLFARH